MKRKKGKEIIVVSRLWRLRLEASCLLSVGRQPSGATAFHLNEFSNWDTYVLLAQGQN